MGSVKPTQLLIERIKGVMLLRVVLVTIFLSGALLLDINALVDWSSPRVVTLVSLIVLTYALTIIYAVLLPRLKGLRGLGRAQVAMDLLVTGTLIIATGGMRSSVFLFTLFLPIIAAAIMLGRGAALISATFTSGVIVILASMAIGYIESPFSEQSFVIQSAAYVRSVLFESSLHIVTSYLLAWISGQLAKQLGEIKSELAQQQVDIRELRALNENILESLNSGLISITLGQMIIYFNQAAEQITGLNAAAVFGRPLNEVFPQIADHLPDPMRTLSNQERRFEGRYERPDGEEIYLGFSISVLRNALRQPSGQIVIFQDLTHIKQLEQHAKRSEHLAAIGQLSAAIAHEIRNPLASISGSVEMLQMMSSGDDDERMLMDIILREVHRLNALITQFLEYSRPRHMMFEPLDVATLLDEILSLFRHRAGHVIIEAEISPKTKSKEFMLDREALRQVIWNLLNNAIESMTQAKSEAKLHVRLELVEDMFLSQQLILSVEDSGPGVPEKLKTRIFEPFFTTKTQGTGLGLATLYRLIEEHGGQCALEEPEELQGARFVVRLPAITAQEAADASRPQQDLEDHEQDAPPA